MKLMTRPVVNDFRHGRADRAPNGMRKAARTRDSSRKSRSLGMRAKLTTAARKYATIAPNE